MQTYNNTSKRRVSKDHNLPSAMYHPPSPGASVSASARLSDQQAEQPKTKLLAQFRADWDFPRMVASLPPGSKTYFTSSPYFAKDVKFTLRTLRAFEKLAELVPKEQREAKLEELGGMLCGRHKGHKRKGWPEDKKWPIGGTDEQKDENMGLDVKELIKELEPTFQDSEEDDRTADDKTTAHVRNEPSTNKTRAELSTSSTRAPSDTNKAPRPRSLSVVDEEKSNEDRQALLTAISDNWPSWSIAKYLPKHAVPLGRPVADWPFGLLQAVLELSRATAGRDKEVRDRLAEEFRSKKKRFSHQTSLDSIKAVRNSFNGKGKMARTESSGDEQADNTNVVAGPSTEQTAPSQTEPAVKPSTSSTAKATTELRSAPTAEPPTQPTHKRPDDQDSTSEPPPKRAKHAAEEQNAPAPASPTQDPVSPSVAGSEPTRSRRYLSGQINKQIIVAEFNKILLQ
ncbi:hypothetical protein ST47_g4707 [Ascochyta rabiei]|uniref:Uncharacterized protein n=1 Tax=Didymella rabiei TaxID=5454 RepID=A0A163F5L9_DIDRA|nr:hypothetical protein ST47_g4707 [Ascochyta rabiei]